MVITKQNVQTITIYGVLVLYKLFIIIKYHIC